MFTIEEMNDKLNKIHCMDCLDFMREVPDKYFDLVLTSPPYNIGAVHHTGAKRFSPYFDDMPEEQYQQWQISILNELQRIIKDDGSILYNHKNRIKNGVQISPYSWIFKTNLTIKQELVWFNRSQNFDKIRFYPMTERIYWLSNGVNTTFFNEINHHDLFNNSEFPSEGIDKKHKRAFPLAMAENLIKNFNAKTVFDPFMGSGTTAVACKSLGIDFVGCELDPDYVAIANKRLSQVQGSLF